MHGLFCCRGEELDFPGNCLSVVANPASPETLNPILCGLGPANRIFLFFQLEVIQLETYNLGSVNIILV